MFRHSKNKSLTSLQPFQLPFLSRKTFASTISSAPAGRGENRVTPQKAVVDQVYHRFPHVKNCHFDG